MFPKTISSSKIVLFLKENKFSRVFFLMSLALFFISFFLNYFHFINSDFEVTVKALTNNSIYIFSKLEINLFYVFFGFILVLNILIARRVHGLDSFLSKLIAFGTFVLSLLILVFTSVIILTN